MTNDSDIRQVLERLADEETLGETESRAVFSQIMEGRADLAQMAAFLMALRVRGETVEEITGGAQALRDKAETVTLKGDLVDTCGTGGDGLHTYNISTAAAIVAAACGARVAKHGNRSVSSKSGSADVLMALGANLELSPLQNEQCLNATGFAFMFAPAHHKAMRHVAPVRASLKLRSIFNLLGPLANPANAPNQLLGVYDRKWLRPLAEVLKRLGSKRAWIVHGADGLDEISLSGITHVCALEDDRIEEFDVHPGDFGLNVSGLSAIRGGDSVRNASAMRDIFAGQESAYADIVALNAGATLYLGQIAPTAAEGVALARRALQTGAALKRLECWVQKTHALKGQNDG